MLNDGNSNGYNNDDETLLIYVGGGVLTQHTV